MAFRDTNSDFLGLSMTHFLRLISYLLTYYLLTSIGMISKPACKISIFLFAISPFVCVTLFSINFTAECRFCYLDRTLSFLKIRLETINIIEILEISENIAKYKIVVL